MAGNGYFITFEGIDRSGKSTQAAMLAQSLGEDRALLVREPGGTPAAERIRELLKDAATPLTDRAEALLFTAARADLVATVIEPALDQGRVVIADRFIDSTLAYQGVVRGLGLANVARLNEWACDGLVPDLTILLDIDAERAVSRGVEDGDRFEAEGLEFQQQVANAYRQIANQAEDRIVQIAGDHPPAQIHSEVLALVRGRLGDTLA